MKRVRPQGTVDCDELIGWLVINDKNYKRSWNLEELSKDSGVELVARLCNLSTVDVCQKMFCAIMKLQQPAEEFHNGLRSSQTKSKL